MAEKRKRPIRPTPKPGEEAVERGEGHRRQVELEGEEIELRQFAAPEADEGNPGGPEVSPMDLLETMVKSEPVNLPEIEEEFRRAIRELPAQRRREGIGKRKRRPLP